MGFFPQPQRVVIDHTRAAEHPGELHLLPRRGAQAVTVSDQHGTGIYTRPQTVTGDYRRGRHVVSALPVHMVFVTKCRRSWVGEHIPFLAEVFGYECSEFGAVLAECYGEDDHVHLLAEYLPKMCVATLVNSLNGMPVWILRQRYWIRTHREHLRSPFYFAAFCGCAPLPIIPQYVEQQRAPGG
jgi:putative transposase